jgi:hypothetical protein
MYVLLIRQLSWAMYYWKMSHLVWAGYKWTPLDLTLLLVCAVCVWAAPCLIRLLVWARYLWTPPLLAPLFINIEVDVWYAYVFILLNLVQLLA